MTMFRAVSLLLLAVWLWASLAVANDARVAFIRPPAFATEAEAVRVQIRVTPHAENRRLVLSLGDDFSALRSSEEPLEGDRAPRTRWIQWIRLPPGEWVIVAALYGIGPTPLARVTTPITISKVGPP